MTSHVGRLYAAAVSLVVFFVLWAAIAANPWETTSTDPRVVALAQREAALRRDAKLVREIVARRTAAAAAARQTAAATPAPVRIVNLPPLVVTRTS
jgi:hypothetical protein